MRTRRGWTGGAVLAMAIVTGAADPAGAQLCAPGRPPINKPGFRAGAEVRWTTRPSPGGAPFPEEMRACVARAFEAWTAINRKTRLHVRFEPGEGGVIVRFDKPGGLVLTDRRAGAWTNGVRGDDQALEQAAIWITSDASLVGSCDAVTKIVLHELGHLHGLADTPRHRGPSVMNNAGGPDDQRGRLPLEPTICDAAQAAAATTGSSRLARARSGR